MSEISFKPIDQRHFQKKKIRQYFVSRNLGHSQTQSEIPTLSQLQLNQNVQSIFKNEKLYHQANSRYIPKKLSKMREIVQNTQVNFFDHRAERRGTQVLNVYLKKNDKNLNQTS